CRSNGKNALSSLRKLQTYDRGRYRSVGHLMQCFANGIERISADDSGDCGKTAARNEWQYEASTKAVSTTHRIGRGQTLLANRDSWPTFCAIFVVRCVVVRSLLPPSEKRAVAHAKCGGRPPR